MRNNLAMLFLMLCTILCIIVTWVIVDKSNSPQTVIVGPNQPYFWSPGYSLELNGQYQFKYSTYFEIIQDDHIITADLEPPLPGETDGTYWVRDLSVNQEITLRQGYAWVFSLEQTSFTATPNVWEKFWHIFGGSVLGLFAWVVCFFIATKIAS